MSKHLPVIFLTLLASTATAQDPFADNVVDFIPGTGIPSEFGSDPPIFFDDPTTALGSPTRVNSFGDPITPFSAPFLASEVVSIGEGGSLTVSFDEPVLNDPDNPFGIDLLVFGNSFFSVTFGPPPDFATDETSTATGLSGEGGIVSVSADGIEFFEVVGVEADGLFPTNGFTDTVAPFPTTASAPSDFTLPVDPSLTAADFIGLTTAEIIALFDGSGGGLGIDIGALGLSEISFVRIANPEGSGVIPEIDGFVDVRAVPEPSTCLLLLSATCFPRRRRRA